MSVLALSGTVQEWAIVKPAQLAGIVVAAFVVRFVAHRIIDRLTP